MHYATLLAASCEEQLGQKGQKSRSHSASAHNLRGVYNPGFLIKNPAKSSLPCCESKTPHTVTVALKASPSIPWRQPRGRPSHRSALPDQRYNQIPHPHSGGTPGLDLACSPGQSPRLLLQLWWLHSTRASTWPLWPCCWWIPSRSTHLYHTHHTPCLSTMAVWCVMADDDICLFETELSQAVQEND